MSGMSWLILLRLLKRLEITLSWAILSLKKRISTLQPEKVILSLAISRRVLVSDSNISIKLARPSTIL